MKKRHFNQFPKKIIDSQEISKRAIEVPSIREKENQDWLKWQRQVIREEAMAETKK